MTYGDHNHGLSTSPMPVWVSHQPNQWSYQVPNHSHSISSQFAMANPIKEPEMTAAEKIAKERREAREKREAEARYNDLAQVVEVAPVGDVLAWSEHGSERAAVHNADGWRITGFTCVFSTESLIAFLVDHDADTIGTDIPATI